MAQWKTNRTVEFRFCDPSRSYPEIKEKRKVKITSPEEMYNNFRFLFENSVREKFVVFWLNSSNGVIGFETISEGNLNSSVVHAREIFRGACVASCASIILAHNHPSGNLEPSNEDIQITKKIVEAGKIIGIPVFDHIIFTNDSYISFVERRII